MNAIGMKLASMTGAAIAIGIALVIIGLPIFCIIKFVKKGMAGEDVYTKWTIFTAVFCILVFPIGLSSAIAEIMTYIMSKDRKNKNANEQKYRGCYHEPNPGSTADYERWKAEREKGETE